MIVKYRTRLTGLLRNSVNTTLKCSVFCFSYVENIVGLKDFIWYYVVDIILWYLIRYPAIMMKIVIQQHKRHTVADTTHMEYKTIQYRRSSSYMKPCFTVEWAYDEINKPIWRNSDDDTGDGSE